MNRISNYDRLMILSHTPEFREGLLKLKGRFFLEENKAFALHWGVDCAFIEEYRRLCEHADGLRTEREFVNFSEVVNKIPIFDGTSNNYPVRVLRELPDLLTSVKEVRYDREGYPEGINHITISKSPEHSDIRHMQEGRYLIIELDLFTPKKQLLEAVGNEISHYQTAMNKPSKRQKQQHIDHWAAYRWHDVEGLPLHEIAARIIGAAPKMFSGEDPMGAAQQAVHRAVLKARKMLKSRSPLNA